VRRLTNDELAAAIEAERKWLESEGPRCVYCGHRAAFHTSDGDLWAHWCLVDECLCDAEEIFAT